jgi:hypothetical protein
MKVQSHVSMGILMALLLVAGQYGGAQTKGRMTTADILAALKPGQWVELEGTVRPDLSVLCTEIKLLTGDLLDDDWKITGIIRKINKEKQDIDIGRLSIKIQSQTEFDDDHGKFKSFADMKTNMLIQVEGTYLKDGTFLANQIENNSAKLLEKPERKDRLEVRGRVEHIDPTSRTITLMGMSFQLTERTKGKSAIK